MTRRSIAVFVAAALAEIGGAYLVWAGLLGASSASARLPGDWLSRASVHLIGAAICLVGAAVIMYAPR